VTHQPAPCTIDFTVVLQPGDALTCLKYVAALQGTTVQVRARVQKSDGSFVEDVRTILLIDTRPTATPTMTPTPTETPITPIPTPTIEPPAFAPRSTTLYAGVSSPPSCNGISQTFTVTGGAPPFVISASGEACLSTTTVDASGGTVTITSGNQVGSFLVTATDMLGRIATLSLTQQGAPAAFIDVDLFEDRRNDNGDGSFTSIASALLTDEFGAIVPDGVPVEFSLVNPVSGVSITSPGMTHSKAPCDAGSLTVVPQPGDALACIKYISSRQGSTVTIRARVTTQSGDVIEATRTVRLPDTRPASPTQTFTITATPTITPIPSITPTETPFPEGVPTFTPTMTLTVTQPPTATPTSPPGSIQFVGADPVQLGVRSSGRPEQSVLSYLVRDVQNQPISGVPVTFTLTGTGTESISPLVAFTDMSGKVTTTLTSGTRASTIRVTASVDVNGDGIGDIFSSSVGVAVLGGPPTANRFSVGAQTVNVAGRVTSGLQVPISAFLNDRFGNAVPLGTAVAFVSNASSVVNPTTTNALGVATATLLSEQVVPPTGIVTVLGFTLGEESFLDNNGDGRYQQGEPLLVDNIPEPYVDFRPLPTALNPSGPNDADCSVLAPSHLCNNQFDINKPFEFFIDTPPLDQVPGVQGTSGTLDTNVFLWDTAVVTFSGPLVTPVAQPNFITLKPGQTTTITVEVHDDIQNPLTSACVVELDASGADVIVDGANSSFGSREIPDGQSFNQIIEGLTKFTFSLTALSDASIHDFSISVRVTGLGSAACPNGAGTFIVATGSIVPGP
ncbi:MAG TPA: Ig-like domain-containing protein, partial [Candidatus Acidoferrales bacterium]|nr:Ig-like domain-containing protein [Candidatus Acidoferrales bacterium]